MQSTGKLSKAAYIFLSSAKNSRTHHLLPGSTAAGETLCPGSPRDVLQAGQWCNYKIWSRSWDIQANQFWKDLLVISERLATSQHKVCRSGDVTTYFLHQSYVRELFWWKATVTRMIWPMISRFTSLRVKSIIIVWLKANRFSGVTAGLRASITLLQLWDLPHPRDHNMPSGKVAQKNEECLQMSYLIPIR